MTAKTTTIIEQFGVVNGTWRNAPHNQVAVRAPKDSYDRKGNLFVVAEAQGQISQLEVVEKHLVGLVRDTYYPASGGITASLRRAVQAANAWLFQQNQAVPEEKFILAGVVIAVVRDDDVFVAQIGPTALFSSLGKFVQRYPDASPWLDQQGEQPFDDSVLGVYRFVEPQIVHLQAQPGDMVVLSDGRLARQLSVREVAGIMKARGSVEVVSQKLAQSAQIQHCSAMVLQVTADTSVRQPVLQIHTKTPEVAVAGEKKGFNFAMPALLQKRGGTSAPETNYEPEPSDRHYADYDGDEDEDWLEEAEANQNWQGDVSQMFAKIMAAIAGSLSFLGGGLHTVLKLVLPGSQETTRKSGAKAQSKGMKRPSDKALRYVAIGLPVLVVIIVSIVYWYRGYRQELAYAELYADAEQKLATAQSAPPENAVQLLNEAESQLGELQLLKEDQAEIDSMQSVIAQQRDEIGQVERLYYVPELHRYAESGTQLSRVIVQGVDVYVLDTGLDRVMHHTLDSIGDALLPNDPNPLLVQRGQQLEGALIGDIIDIVWMPAAGGRQTNDMLILTPEGLVEFNSDWGASSIPISGVEQWQSPVAASSYFGNFYLLDSQANQLYRYWPAFEGYENPADSYFLDPAAVDLQGAVDMAIDGSIFVLYQNGTIRKFLGGEPTEFQLQGLDVPFNNPVSIYTAPDEQAQYLYVADAGNQRIVQLTKEGQFMRQFKPRLEDGIVFDDLRSIFVDEIGGKIFVLNGTSLYAPNIPVE